MNHHSANGHKPPTCARCATDSGSRRPTARCRVSPPLIRATTMPSMTASAVPAPRVVTFAPDSQARNLSPRRHRRSALDSCWKKPWDARWKSNSPCACRSVPTRSPTSGSCRCAHWRCLARGRRGSDGGRRTGPPALPERAGARQRPHQDIRDIVVVDFHRFERPRSQEVARQLAHLNAKLTEAGRRPIC